MKKLLLLLSILSIGCTSNNINTNESIYWVNSTKVGCIGVGPMHCLQVKKNMALNSGTWSNFYDKIEGFDYTPGYLYKIKVKEEKLNLDNVPADASSIKYTLIEILNKEPDKTLRINDIWQIEKIENELLTSDFEYPTMEINLAKSTITGKAICNNIQGFIMEFTGTIIRFSSLTTTRKMCPLIDEETRYLNAMGRVVTYTIANNRLEFFDLYEQSLLTFKKVD